MRTLLAKIDGRGWLAAGNWLLVVLVLLLLAFVPDLRKDDLFKMIAQAIVMSGFINLILAFYFTASKADHQPPPADSVPVTDPAPAPLTPGAPAA